MEVIRIPVGYLEANCYLVINNGNVLIVDPGSEFEKIDLKIKQLNLTPIGILVTHHHFDHIGALEQMKDKYKICVCDSSNRIKFDGFDYLILDTPGHTSDSVTFYFNKDFIMFTGDFLFKETIGRTDLETGNALKMKESIDKIKKYPSNTLIYPGHGDTTTLEDELKNNYYLN